jgi:uncharacterized membrane protein HdeD (DUF308 family)
VTTHYLDHPERGETKVLNGWSYLGGALLGPLYVLYHRFTGPALLMLVYSIAIAAAGAGLCTLVAILSDEPALVIVGVAGIGVLALATQGAAAVELVRRAYIREGYREGYY